MTAELLGDALGHHELVQVIGGGASGLVYEAFDPREGRHVAIRTFRLDAMEPQAAATFEARLRAQTAAAAALQHPNIVAVYDCDRQGQTASQAMEFVEGENLAQHLARVGSLPALQALALVAQLLSALEAAHARGLAHGRIEPAHLLVSRAGRLKVLGFGVPQPVEPTVADDLYRSAVVAYQMFTGESPSQRPGQDGGRLAPHQLRPDLPVALDGVFERALSDDPQARYGSAGELSAALRGAFEAPLWQRPAKEDRPVPAAEPRKEAVRVPVPPAAMASRPAAVRPPATTSSSNAPALTANGRRLGIAAAVASIIGVLVVGGLLLTGGFDAGTDTAADARPDVTVAQPSSPSPSAPEPATPSASISAAPPPAARPTAPPVAVSPEPAPAAPQVATRPEPVAPTAPQVATRPEPVAPPAVARATPRAPAAVQPRTPERAPERAPEPAPVAAVPATPEPPRVEPRAPAPVQAARPPAEDLATAGAGPVPRSEPPAAAAAVSGPVVDAPAAGSSPAVASAAAGAAPGGAPAAAPSTSGTATVITPAIVAGAAPDNRSASANEPTIVARQSRVEDGRQSARGDPYAACSHQQLLIAREVCNAAQCEDPQWRSHPTCVRRHAEQRARDQRDDQTERTR
jgi:hypothetical protein